MTRECSWCKKEVSGTMVDYPPRERHLSILRLSVPPARPMSEDITAYICDDCEKRLREMIDKIKEHP